MKKILAAIVFLALVVAVSYVKSVRQKTQTTTAYEEGKQDGVQQIKDLNKNIDSLSYLIDQQDVDLAKSVWERELVYRSAYDSLLRVIDSTNTVRDSLKNSGEPVQGRRETGETNIDSAKNGLLRHKEILSFYKKRYRTLPKDLSPYEKRVALAEIREQTTEKFAITLAELNNIRRDNKLDY